MSLIVSLLHVARNAVFIGLTNSVSWYYRASYRGRWPASDAGSFVSV